MGTSHSGNDYERLKEELRRMKRRGAPWYFESALHQRLHGGSGRRPRLRPISIVPVLGIAVLTLSILGVAVYVVLLHTNLVTVPGAGVRGPAADTLSRVSMADTVHTAPAGGAAHGRVPAPVPVRTPVPEPVPADTQRAPQQESPHEGRDTSGARSDTAGARSDSASRTTDTSASPGAGGQIGRMP